MHFFSSHELCAFKLKNINFHPEAHLQDHCDEI